MTHRQNVYWDDAYVVRGGFETVSKSGALVASLKRKPVEGADVTAPWILDDLIASLYKIHDKRYVHKVLQGASSEHGPEALASVLASTAGMLSAADDLIYGDALRSGSLSSGMHHAGRDYGSGFCTFNGVAAAAHRLSKHFGSVLVIDTDAHCGGGTWSIVRRFANVGQVDLVTSAYDDYDTRSPRSVKAVVRKAKNYLPTLEDLLVDWMVGNGEPDAIVYNAGMDPFQGCDVGGLRGVSGAMLRARERMVFDFADEYRAPIMWALAGGYVGSRCSSKTLTALHRSTVEEAAV